MKGYNFTERVRMVLAVAREEAQRLHHEYVGTEHILLGLIREAEGLHGEGVASAALHNLGADPDEIRRQINEILKTGKQPATGHDLPYTSRSKKVLELAMAEARDLHHNYVGTEHVLLGLLREEKGIAAQVLNAAGITSEKARAEVLRLLGQAEGGMESARTASLKFKGTDTKSVEIRSYNLKRGTRPAFHRVMCEEAIPMMRRWKIDVVSCAPSPHDDDSYYLIRAYASLADRAERQAAFYGSDEWRNGPRERILEAIESQTSIVIQIDKETLDSLRTI
jgi:ATP-dependent Clp protease ATP-binding subunit ClpA